MAWRNLIWKFGIILSMLILSVLTKSVSIENSVYSLPVIATDNKFAGLFIPENFADLEHTFNNKIKNETMNPETKSNNVKTVTEDEHSNSTTVTKSSIPNTLRQKLLRPKQVVRNYDVEITINGDQFNGKAMIDLRITDVNTTDNELMFYAQNITIQSVMLGINSAENAVVIDSFDATDGILKITPHRPGNSFIVIIEYNGPIRNDGTGIFRGDFNDHQYLGMNTYPTYARRVFPCVDKLTEVAPVLISFKNTGFPMMEANSVLADNSVTQFRALTTSLHVWGMVAHNFQTVMIPVDGVVLRGRTRLNQDAQAIAAIQFFFNNLIEWTQKNYFEIIADQNGQMNIFALTDTSVDWTALSTVCVWEPYIYMEPIHSVAQRKTALLKIADSMARQWFNFIIFPENWRHDWALTGLRTHAVYDIVKQFQTDMTGVDVTLLDMNTIFVTDIIQESLLRDGYATAEPLLSADDFFDDFRIRDYINGLIKFKSPAIMWMLRLILGNEDRDCIKLASQSLINRRAFEAKTSQDVIKAIENEYLSEINPLINDDLEDFLDPWINNRGYPFINVGLTQNGVVVTQEHFGFNTESRQTFKIPITFTTSTDMDFGNIYPIQMMNGTIFLPMELDEEKRDFVLFNIQGQGYFRVTYDIKLWERIIECLEEPYCRNQIHPLNRATLIDDALNLARAGKLSYNIAFQVVLTMEHETEYAPWKAFIRNMGFLKKRLEALVAENEDLNQDIYLRMVRRSIVTLENRLTFNPDPNLVEPAMVSLTRGMVMDHACRSGYQPCIAAAIDWFYDPDNVDEVNPNIPKDLRPAVYCAMAREGDAGTINALNERLKVEPSHWERVVILESLACSQDATFINRLLLQTIAIGSPYGIEERSRIFKAVAESSYQNARIAINFMQLQTNVIRNTYGGATKLEELIYVLADNAANQEQTFILTAWINSITTNNLQDSQDLAVRHRLMAEENVLWDSNHRDEVYKWIDENNAPKYVTSTVLIFVTLFVTIFNN